MPGVKIKIDVADAKVAVDRLQKDLKALGASSVLTESQMKKLESRMLQKLGTDEAAKSLDRLTKSIGLSKREVVVLREKLGEHLTMTEKLKASWGALKQNWMGVTGAIVGGYMAFMKVKEYLKLGAEAMQAEQAYAAMTESMGVNADELTEKMRKASKGMVDESKLMQKAVFAMDQEIDPNKIPALMEAARVASRKTGQDITSSTDAIIDAVGANMPRALKRMGLITKEQMELVNRAMAMGVTDVKLLDIVLANASVSSARLAIETDNANEKLAQFSATFQNMKETAGKEGWKVIEAGEAVLLGFGSAAATAVAGVQKLRAEMKEMEAGRETDPAKIAMLRAQSGKLRESSREWAIKGLTWGKSGRSYFTGEEIPNYEAMAVTPTPEGAIRRRLSAENKQYYAEQARAKAEQDLRDQINEGTRAKQRAENIKEIHAKELQAAEDASKTELYIYEQKVHKQSLVETKALDDRKKINAMYYQKRLEEIDAEATARDKTDKMFKYMKDDFIAGEKQKLDAEMKVRKAEEVNSQKRINFIRQQEEENENYRIAEQLGKRRLEMDKRDLEITLMKVQADKQAGDARIAAERKILDLRARYGLVTPKEGATADLDSRRKYLENEAKGLTDTITEKSRAATDADEDAQKEIYQLLLQRKQVLEEIADVEEEMAWTVKEYSGGMTEGMVTGLRNYRNQIGSEFQIWEKFAGDAAKGMESTFSDLFFDVLTGEFESFGDYLTNFGKSLGRAFSDAMAKEIMSGNLLESAGGWIFDLMSGGSFFGVRKGAAFHGGRVLPFAHGGIVTRPTLFPMAGGVGLMGEAGPEAVMPLARNKQGELGVKGSGPSSLTVNVPVNVEGGSAKQSQELRREIENTVQRVVSRWS